MSTLVRKRREPAGRVSYTWDGRDNVDRIVAEARYRPRVQIERNGRTIVLPNPIRVDTTAPRIRIVARLPTGLLARRRRSARSHHGQLRGRRAGAGDDARRRAAARAEPVPTARGQARLVRPRRWASCATGDLRSSASCRRPGRQPVREDACGAGAGSGTSSFPAIASRSSRASASRCGSSPTRGRTGGFLPARRESGNARFWCCVRPRHPGRTSSSSRSKAAPTRPRSTFRHRNDATSDRARREPLGHDASPHHVGPVSGNRDPRRVVLRSAARSAASPVSRPRAVPRRPEPDSHDPGMGARGRRRGTAPPFADEQRTRRSPRSSKPMRQRCGKARWGDKTPMYMRHLGLIERLFPDAQYVHLIRDGRDAALSFLEMPDGTFTRTWAHPRKTSEFACLWRREVRGARALGRRVGARRYYEVRYEDLVATPSPVVESICDFANLTFEPAMVEYAGVVDVSEKPHQQRLLHPPTAGLRSWRRDMSPGEARSVRERRRQPPRAVRLRASRSTAALADRPGPGRARLVQRAARRVECHGIGAAAVAALAPATPSAVGEECLAPTASTCRGRALREVVRSARRSTCARSRCRVSSAPSEAARRSPRPTPQRIRSLLEGREEHVLADDDRRAEDPPAHPSAPELAPARRTERPQPPVEPSREHASRRRPQVSCSRARRPALSRRSGRSRRRVRRPCQSARPSRSALRPSMGSHRSSRTGTRRA